MIVFLQGFPRERIYDWTSKEKSSTLDKSHGLKKEEKEKDKKDIKKDISSETESDKRNVKVKQGTNEMLESDNPPPEYKPEYMVNDVHDNEVLMAFSFALSSCLDWLQ